MTDSITHKQVADALFDAYKNHKVSLKDAFYNPAFHNLPLSSKVELVKRYAQVHKEPKTGISSSGALSIAKKSLEGGAGGALGTFITAGVANGLKHSLLGNGYNKELADKIFDRAVALSIPMAAVGALAAGVREYGNQRQDAKSRNSLRESLEDINTATDENQRTHKALVFLAQLPTRAPEKRPGFHPFSEHVQPIKTLQKAVTPREMTKESGFSTIRKLVKDQ